MEWTSFFETSKVPDSFKENQLAIDTFIKKAHSANRDIVLVSSGGTTVPLESRTVRFIDNFSVGTRGSTSAEYFLRHGYAVIFLHRKGSLEPFRRHFMHTNLLDMLESTTDDELKVHQNYLNHVGPVLMQYKKVKETQSLLQVSFTTLSDYLHYLKATAEAMGSIGKQAMFYLAAAVSDFYIPAEQMPEHKIQSSSGPLQISLQLVPKMLQPLVSVWSPDAFIVSFKLETNPEILIKKSKEAIKRYNHQVVVANILETRKQEVIIVTKDSEDVIRLSDEELKDGKEIEERVIEQLAEKHSQFKQS